MARTLIMLLCTFCSLSLMAQEAEITGSFSNSDFASFAKEIETQTQLKVYYDPLKLDSLVINLDAEDRPLRSVLKEVFEGSKYNFYFFDNYLFILYDQIIQAELPSGFLSGDDSQESSEEILIDFTNAIYEADDIKRNQQIITIGTKSNKIKSGNAVINGTITSENSGEPVIGASIYINDPLIGTVSGSDGSFSLSIPKGRHVLNVTSVGMRSIAYDIILYSNGNLDLSLQESATSLNEVVVESDRDDNLLQAELGIEKITIKDVKMVPTALGEADIVRVMLTLPGVKSVGEASNGFNVRGGSTDQNLILYNESTIYNPSHLFGFFSAFNPDVVDAAQLYKSSIPSRYGGRLSSVLQVNSRVGNKEKLSGAGGIGPVTGRFSLEGPIVKDKTSFLIGGRANYSNWILNTVNNPDYEGSEGSFYDVNFDINHTFDEKNSLSLYGYRSNDRFRLREDTLYRYSNNIAGLKWRHTFNKSLYSDVSAGLSNYQYNVSSSSNPVNAFDLEFGISQLDFRADFNYFTQSGHNFNFGASNIYYSVRSGELKPSGAESLVTEDLLQDEQATETAFYVSDNFDITSKLNVNLGVRYTLFRNIGPRSYYVYASEVPKSNATIIDTVSAASGELVKAYNRPEYRFAARYLLSDYSSIKFGFNTMNQFIHRISNTVAVSPTDVWKLSDFNIKPQSGNQVSIGYFRNSKSGIIEASVELYYKRFENFLDYKSGAVVIMNPTLEADVINTKGRAYGIEFLIKKTRGKLNGWLGYTYSRSEIQQDDQFAGEVINAGAWYPSNFDKPHDFTSVANYKLTKRYSVSFNLTYSTGRPITVPLEQFVFGGTNRLLYSDRNEFRVPDYFRIDLAFNLEGNHKKQKLAHGSWTFAVYNLTGRKNANSVYFISESTGVQGYRLAIFGQPIPTITYNFKF